MEKSSSDPLQGIVTHNLFQFDHDTPNHDRFQLVWRSRFGSFLLVSQTKKKLSNCHLEKVCHFRHIKVLLVLLFCFLYENKKTKQTYAILEEILEAVQNQAEQTTF